MAADCRQLINLAMREDLDLPDGRDLTSAALIDPAAAGRAAVAAREEITIAGLPAAELAANQYGKNLSFSTQAADGEQAPAGGVLAEISGPAATMLAVERVMLNFLGRLCGIATLTRRYVEAVAGTPAHIYDTRKTTPGWRRLEKYAVRCGGGRNHRTGLYDAVLIKDNHLAQGRAGDSFTPATAVRAARQFIRDAGASTDTGAPVEIEVDSLQQLQAVLPEQPDIVLLDNMTPPLLRAAVALRDEISPAVQLEASGGITIDNVREIAQAGVERISVGALTHSARWVDIGLDWLD